MAAGVASAARRGVEFRLANELSCEIGGALIAVFAKELSDDPASEDKDGRGAASDAVTLLPACWLESCIKDDRDCEASDGSGADDGFESDASADRSSSAIFNPPY